MKAEKGEKGLKKEVENDIPKLDILNVVKRTFTNNLKFVSTLESIGFGLVLGANFEQNVRIMSRQKRRVGVLTHTQRLKIKSIRSILLLFSIFSSFFA